MEEERQKKKKARAEVYHEKQRLQFCLLHSLNNLFQAKDAFTAEKLNNVAKRLELDDPDKRTWTPLSAIFKPHRNALTGNYDVNVLIGAVEERGKRVVWHDRRTGASSIDLDDAGEKLMGIVVNTPVKKYGGIWKSRHWIALKKIHGVWYNLDSDLAAPRSFVDCTELREFLDAMVRDGAEVMLILNE